MTPWTWPPLAMVGGSVIGAGLIASGLQNIFAPATVPANFGLPHPAASPVVLAANSAGPSASVSTRTPTITPREITEQWIRVTGGRTLALGLCLLIFAAQNKRRDVGAMMLCGVVSSIIDFIVTFRHSPTRGAPWTHAFGSTNLTLLGGWLLLG